MQKIHLYFLIACFGLSLPGNAQAADLADAFRQPPADTRPGCYWYWINDNVSKEGITKDLEAMVRVGIGRAYIGHIFGEGNRWETPVGKVPFMSDAWWNAVQWAVKEAGRLGIDIGFFNAPGWSQSGGPWVKPSQSMRFLDASETVLEGGRRIVQVLPMPEIKTYPLAGGLEQKAAGPKFTEKEFQDVKVIAFRQPEAEAQEIDMIKVKVSSPDLKNLSALLDGDVKTALKIGPKTRQIDFALDGGTPVQSVRIEPVDHLYTLTCVVSISDDGKSFREWVRHVEQRGHQGPRNKNPILVPFRETKAPFLRIVLSASRDVSFSALSLSRRAVLGHYVRKQLGETDPSVRPAWNAYVWQDQAAPAPGSVLDSSSIVDLTDKMDAAGKLTWDAPPGRWVVMRTGMVPIGTMCAPASPQSRGLEVDKMSKAHVHSLFEGMVGEFIRRTPPEDRKAFKYVIADSYETGPQNWTDGMAETFVKRFGYSPVRFLPCFTGRIVDSPEVSSRFLWDWRRMVAESIATEYVGGLREISNRNGLKLWLENYGHWGFPSEFLLYGSMSDQISGEFWENGEPLNDVESRAASSCSRIYGRTDVYVEAFTSNRSFEQSPASIKHWCDWVYANGINHHILHVYIHQPEERKPGIIAWFGTAFNRHNTWFELSKGFFDYTRRNTVLLKTGSPVIDVAYYIGENAPSMQGPRQPALPDGYDFDYINSDVLMHRAKVVGGRIAVPNGPSYAVLVLPDQNTMRPEVAAAIRRLVRDGATVVGPKPSRSPSLAGFPACDENLRNIANEIWGSMEPHGRPVQALGKGHVHAGLPLEDVLAGLKLQPDVQVLSETPLLCAAAGAGKIGIRAKGGIVFQHRSTPQREIYFLANTSDRPVDFTASLRVGGRQPELWNPNTGTIVTARAFSQRDGRTLVPLRLDAAESIYVVFAGPIAADAAGSAKTNAPERELAATLEGPWTVHFEGPGAPGTTHLSSLSDWSQHPEEAVRNFSGTAAYETTFTHVPEARSPRTVLALGKVADIARITINGRSAGIVWTTPWTLDITEYLQTGRNALRIEVANQWHNRLLADAALPPERQSAHISQPYRPSSRKPLPGGLLGPVRLLRER